MVAQSDVVAIDVLIEPDVLLADRAGALNARLRRDHPEGTALDATHVPHISILHCYVRRSDLARVAAVVGGIVRTSALVGTALRAAGYEISEWQGETLVSINVQRTPRLQQLQEQLVAALAHFSVPEAGPDAFVRSPGPPHIDAATVAYVASFVPARTGANWRPHLTVGTAIPRTAAALREEGFAAFEFAIARFAIYQLGNKGTARLLLWH